MHVTFFNGCFNVNSKEEGVLYAEDDVMIEVGSAKQGKNSAKEQAGTNDYLEKGDQSKEWEQNATSIEAKPREVPNLSSARSEPDRSTLEAHIREEGVFLVSDEKERDDVKNLEDDVIYRHSERMEDDHIHGDAVREKPLFVSAMSQQNLQVLKLIFSADTAIPFPLLERTPTMN